MSRFVMVCARRGDALPSASQLAHLARHLTPDDLTDVPTEIAAGDGVATLLIAPSSAVARTPDAFCLGTTIASTDDWSSVGAPSPEGSFALVRKGLDRVELLSDEVASRTLWFAHTPERFVVSTSARALVALLGSFELDPEALAWCLSSGTLGPQAAWDRRIERLAPRTRVTLDRASWALSRQTRDVEFRPQNLSRDEHARRLREAVSSACAGLNLDGAWRLPLSGGYDSRAILLSLGARAPRCLTWGLARSLDEPGNDAYVARALARSVGAAHDYLPTEVSEATGAAQAVLDRFLFNGEGRCDHLSAYADGFALWKRLHDAGIEGVIRGDEGFGWRPVISSADVTRSVGALRPDDCFSPRALDAYQLASPRWPYPLARRAGESLPTWRDRLYHGFRVPTVLAALNDLKLPYVEVAAPLLSARGLEVVRAMPDALRTDKRLFREVVQAMSPAVPFARRGAISEPTRILARADFVAVMRQELRDSRWLSAPLRARLLGGLDAPEASRSLVERVARRLPGRLGSLVRRIEPRASIDPHTLAFRAWLASKMASQLTRDAALLTDVA